MDGILKEAGLQHRCPEGILEWGKDGKWMVEWKELVEWTPEWKWNGATWVAGQVDGPGLILTLPQWTKCLWGGMVQWQSLVPGCILAQPSDAF